MRISGTWMLKSLTSKFTPLHARSGENRVRRVICVEGFDQKARISTTEPDKIKRTVSSTFHTPLPRCHMLACYEGALSISHVLPISYYTRPECNNAWRHMVSPVAEVKLSFFPLHMLVPSSSTVLEPDSSSLRVLLLWDLLWIERGQVAKVIWG